MKDEDITRDTLLVQLTVGQLCDFLRKEGLLMTPSAVKEAVRVTSGPTYVYGIKGIMRLFNVSNVTAQRYKRTIIKDAVCQNGRTIVVNADLALKLFNEKKAEELAFQRTEKVGENFADNNYERENAIEDFKDLTL